MQQAIKIQSSSLNDRFLALFVLGWYAIIYNMLGRSIQTAQGKNPNDYFKSLFKKKFIDPVL
jgi:hypothetical protein